MAALLALLSLVGMASPVLAHGKELTINVASFPSDPKAPGARLYRVFVAYAADLDPVEGATVLLTAERAGGGPAFPEMALKPINEPGLYVGEVTYPVYGTWNVRLTVTEQGTGETDFVEEVTPLTPTADSSAIQRQVLEVFFRFDWKDVVALVMRVAHTVASILLLSLTVTVLAGYLFLSLGARLMLFRRLAPVFLSVALASLAILAVGGVYSGIFSAPTKAPGLLAPATLWQIPFGPAYLGTMVFHIIAGVAITVFTIRIGMALKSLAQMTPRGAGLPTTIQNELSPQVQSVAWTDRRVFRLALVNALLGATVAASVAISVYLHYISHLAVFLPS